MMCIEIILIAAPMGAAVRNEVSKMRQISAYLARAAITATVAVAGVLAVNPNSSLTGEAVRTSTPLDGIKMMKNAKDLPEQRHRRCDADRSNRRGGSFAAMPLSKKEGALSRERRRNDRAAPRGRRFPPSVALDQAPL